MCAIKASRDKTNGEGKIIGVNRVLCASFSVVLSRVKIEVFEVCVIKGGKRVYDFGCVVNSAEKSPATNYC